MKYKIEQEKPDYILDIIETIIVFIAVVVIILSSTNKIRGDDKTKAALAIAIATSSLDEEKPIPKPIPKPNKTCSCSNQCTCGCNEGYSCRCSEGKVMTETKRVFPYYSSVDGGSLPPLITLAKDNPTRLKPIRASIQQTQTIPQIYQPIQTIRPNNYLSFSQGRVIGSNC